MNEYCELWFITVFVWDVMKCVYCRSQLTMMKKKEQMLQEFEEGPLDFQPTYKFDLNSDTYDSR